MTKKLYIKTYGCQMNDYDSSRIADLLADKLHYEKIDTPEQADLILLNTCSVREKAQEKVFSDLGRWKKIKAKNPAILIGVGGCVATQEGKAIIKRAPYVDIVFGPQTLHRLPEMIQEVQTKHKRTIDISFPEIEKFDHLPEPKVDGPSAYVTIMEGCSKRCSYCIVPYTRGKEINRPFDDVMNEIVQLTKQGVKEISLLGQNVNDYRGKISDDQTASLSVLIRQIAKLPNIERIRFTTSHPLAFSDELIETFADVSTLVDHLHLPVQSGSDAILKAMRRGYTSEQYREKIAKLKTVRPNISVSTDIIVGFPGETDEDFHQTLELIKDIYFDHSFSFMYSQRPGTPAAKLKDDVPLEVKKERLSILQNLLNEYDQTISRNMVGTIQKVLITGRSKKNPNQLTGRTENNRIVNFEGSDELIGQLIDMEITHALRYSLKGKTA